ncbi:transposase [Pseudomonas putida]|nr:transposase [Pseudomonas putida]HEN8730978.1 transposase [Pseudomonas putida]
MRFLLSGGQASEISEIDASVPDDLPIYLTLDNYVAHKPEKVRARFAARPRFNIHCTPTSASWMSWVERFFSMSETWITRQAHIIVEDPEASIEHSLKT